MLSKWATENATAAYNQILCLAQIMKVILILCVKSSDFTLPAQPNNVKCPNIAWVNSNGYEHGQNGREKYTQIRMCRHTMWCYKIVYIYTHEIVGKIGKLELVCEDCV